jgi:hypothetical protein
MTRSGVVMSHKTRQWGFCGYLKINLLPRCFDAGCSENTATPGCCAIATGHGILEKCEAKQKHCSQRHAREHVTLFLGGVAQRSEQAAHNRLVAGSSPAAPTKLNTMASLHTETLIWISRELDKLNAEASRVSSLLRRGEMRDIELDIERLEGQFRSLRQKFEFEKNSGGRG